MADSNLIVEFADRVLSRAKSMRISQNELCRMIGVSTTYFNAYKNGTAKALPPSDRMAAIATALETDVTALVNQSVVFNVARPKGSVAIEHADRFFQEISAVVERRLNLEMVHRFGAPRTGDILNWLEMTGGEIHQDNSLYQFIDTHQMPDVTDRMLKPVHIGANSLACEKLQTNSPDKLTRMMALMPEEDMCKVMVRYHKINNAPFDLSRQSISVVSEDEDILVEEDYDCLLYRGRDAQKNDVVVTFASRADPNRE